MDRKTLDLMFRLLDLCDEAITCADAYAGGDSETVDEFKERFSQLSEEFFRLRKD